MLTYTAAYDWAVANIDHEAGEVFGIVQVGSRFYVEIASIRTWPVSTPLRTVIRFDA